MDFSPQFKGKRVTVMGLGVLGRGVGDAAFLAKSGAEVIVTDLKTEKELSESTEKLKDFSNITYTFGKHKKADFEGRDMILVGPKVRMDSEYLEVARASGARLMQSAALFAELSQIPIIGVTGTRGKSTVTQMIHHVLSVTTGEEIILGGNIRGVSNLQLLEQVKDDSIAVMELDSWQLQGFGWAEISPQIAVFTNFMEDHMDYYRASERSVQAGLSTSERAKIESSAYYEAMDAYFADKANIFKYQEESGVFITVSEVFERAKQLAVTRSDLVLRGEVVLADSSVIPEDSYLAMPGEHNRLNAALAYEALKAVSLTDEEIFEGLASFPGVEGRLQLVKTIDPISVDGDRAGIVRIYNDNNATTPQATQAALEALSENNLKSSDDDRTDPNPDERARKNIILICGGADKNISLDDLAAAIGEHTKQVITIPGNGTDRLIELLRGLTPKLGKGSVNRTILSVENLEQAFEEARLAAENGDIILFSPAFASFSQYTNEYERNDEFLKLVDSV